MMGKIIKILFIIMLMASLSGCLYPEEQRQESNASMKTYVALVQAAIDDYHKETGVLPIKNSEMNTPIYEKYQVNYDVLVPHYLDQLPNNDFAKGGNFLYVLVDVETAPTVKLIDLRISKIVRNVQQAIMQYRLQHENKLPLGERVADGVWQIDYKALKMKPVTVISPYSNQSLALLVTENGTVVVDYALDLFPIMKEEGSVKGDLRQILVNHSYFVPVHSLPYKEVNGEPVIDFEMK